MGNNFKSGCGCNNVDCDRFAVNRADAFENLEFDIKIINCAINGLQRAIKELECGCVCEAEHTLRMAICNLETGIQNLICRFESANFEAGCKTRREIDEAICCLNDAIALAHKALEAIESACYKEAIQLIKRAICNAKEGVCGLLEAVREFC